MPKTEYRIYVIELSNKVFTENNLMGSCNVYMWV